MKEPNAFQKPTKGSGAKPGANPCTEPKQTCFIDSLGAHSEPQLGQCGRAIKGSDELVCIAKEHMKKEVPSDINTCPTTARGS